MASPAAVEIEARPPADRGSSVARVLLETASGRQKLVEMRLARHATLEHAIREVVGWLAVLRNVQHGRLGHRGEGAAAFEDERRGSLQRVGTQQHLVEKVLACRCLPLDHLKRVVQRVLAPSKPDRRPERPVTVL